MAIRTIKHGKATTCFVKEHVTHWTEHEGGTADYLRVYFISGEHIDIPQMTAEQFERFYSNGRLPKDD